MPRSHDSREDLRKTQRSYARRIYPLRGIPTEVIIGVECGLKAASAINLDHLATVPKRGLRAFVGGVPPAVLDQVRGALLFALGFDMRTRIG